MTVPNSSLQYASFSVRSLVSSSGSLIVIVSCAVQPSASVTLYVLEPAVTDSVRSPVYGGTPYWAVTLTSVVLPKQGIGSYATFMRISLETW